MYSYVQTYIITMPEIVGIIPVLLHFDQIWSETTGEKTHLFLVPVFCCSIFGLLSRIENELFLECFSIEGNN